VERLEREERPTVLKPQVQRHTARRVLVVEDEPLILMSTIDMVEELGHTVHEAKSAEVALGLLEGH
jgi:CheY-like chemotaxis protein